MESLKSKTPSFLSSYIRGEITIGGWGVVGKGLEVASAFLVISQLDVFKYGVYVLLFAFFSLMSGFFQTMLAGVTYNDIVRNIAEGKEAEAKKLFWETFTVRISVAFVLFIGLLLGAELVAQLYDEDMATLLRMISPLFFISVLSVAMRTLFKMRLHFNLSALRSVVQKGVRLLLLVLFFVFASIDINVAVITSVLAAFISVLVFIPITLKAYIPWRSVRAAKHSVLLPIIKTYGKWSIFGYTLSSLTSNIRPWLIKFFINTEAVAIFSVAESLYGFLKTFVPLETLATLVPREIRDKKKREILFFRGVKYITILSIAFVLVGAILFPPIVYKIFPQYSESVPIFYILLFALPFLGIRSISHTFLVSLRRQKFLFFVLTLKIVGSIILPVTLLYFFGLWGMAFERILITMLASALLFGYLFKFAGFSHGWAVLFTFDNADKAYIRIVLKEIRHALQIKLRKMRVLR